MTVISVGLIYKAWKDIRHDFYPIVTIVILALETGPVTIHFNAIHVISNPIVTLVSYLIASSNYV